MGSGLSQYLQEAAKTPFQWGSADCATFVLGWFDRLSARTRAHLWAGAYDTEEGCAAWSARQGGYSAIAKAFLGGWYDARPCEPKPGNAVCCRYRGTEAMGIRVDGRQVALRTKAGLLITHRVEVLAEFGI